MSHTLKRTLAAVLSIVLTLGCLFTVPFTASAAAATKTFALKSTTEYKDGKATGVVLTLNAQGCTGFKSGKFTITYDSKVLKYDYCDLGKDAAEVTKKCNTAKNKFEGEVNGTSTGKIIYGCYFMEKLWTKDKFNKKENLAHGATSCDVNTDDFEVAVFYFDVKDASAASAAFKLSFGSSAYTTKACTAKLACTDHSSTTTKVAKAATATATGKLNTVCKVCGKVTKTTNILKIGEVKLNTTKYTYNGTAKKPTVTVKNSSGGTISSSYYTVTYSKNNAIGKATATVKFKGRYSGTKTLTFTIVPADVTGVKASSQTTTSVTLKWNPVKGADSYRVYKYDSTAKKYVLLGSPKSTTYTVKNLKSSTKSYTYYVKAAKKVDGTNYFSSNYAKIITSTKTATPKAPTVTAGSKKATVKWTSVSGATGYELYRSTSKTGTFTRAYYGTKLTYTNSGLTSGKTYYYKVRTYKTVNGVKVYSAYSPVVSVKVK